MDVVTGIAATPGGGVDIAGYAYGDLATGQSLGSSDAFVAHYDDGGTQTWMNEFGADGHTDEGASGHPVRVC